MEAKNNQLKLTGTDLEISIETYLDCEIIEEGSVVVNSRIFGDIIRIAGYQCKYRGKG